MGQWDVSRCAHRSSPCPTWDAPTPDWSKLQASAARSGCVMMARRQTSWRRSLEKTQWQMNWKETSPTGMSSLTSSREDSSLYQVRKSLSIWECFFSWKLSRKILKYDRFQVANFMFFFQFLLITAFRPQPEVHMFDSQKCIIQTTPWSQCSKSCGTGISTRVTNNNSECKLVKETRICEVRPCTQSPYSSLKVSLSHHDWMRWKHAWYWKHNTDWPTSKTDLHLPFVSSSAERKEVQQNQEVQSASEIHLRRLLQPEEVQAQVLRSLRGRALLQPSRHQNHPGQVPLRGWRDLQQEHHDDRVLQVHLQLSPCQRSLLPILPPLQRHPQVQRLIGDEHAKPLDKRKTWRHHWRPMTVQMNAGV